MIPAEREVGESHVHPVTARSSLARDRWAARPGDAWFGTMGRDDVTATASRWSGADGDVIGRPPSGFRRAADRALEPRLAQQLLDRFLGRHRVDRQAAPELEPGDRAESRVDLPVPVERRLDALAQRRRVQDEVVGRTVERREPSEDLRAAPRRWRRAPARSRTRSPRRGGAARPRPRTASATRTGRTRRWTRPRRRAGVPRPSSSRTSRQNGHSPSRITNRAAPPSSSATRCGTWGRS